MNVNEPYLTPGGETNGRGATITVSRSFCPGNKEHGESNLVLSSESVLFYVHSHVINSVSQTALSRFIDAAGGWIQNSMIIVPESTAILNIIIHTIYNSSCAHNSPKFEELIEVVDKMPLYGLTPNAIILPDSPTHDLLLSHGTLRPLDVYTLAAYHDIPSLAEKVSSHLLGFSLSNINDERAYRIGAPYLRRLFLLHTNRLEELKKILPEPPYIHPATEDCSFESQEKLAMAWAMGSTYLAWEMRPDISIHTIKSVLESLKDKLKCTDCQAMLEKRIHEVLTSWAAVKCTISLE